MEIQRTITLAFWGMIIKLSGFGAFLDEVQATLVSNQTLSMTSWGIVKKKHKIHFRLSESLEITFAQISVKVKRVLWLCLNQWT